jgi:hypothetical protein
MKPITAEWVGKAEGESADRESALDARRRCRIIRRAALTALGLPT